MEEKRADNQQIEEVMADTRVPDLDIAAEACITPKPNDPCTIVIFGATGDLTARKLMPALFDLFQNSGLPKQFKIVGCGRTDWDDDAFRNRMREALSQGGKGIGGHWDTFGPRLFYCRVDYRDPQSFHGLADRLRALDRKIDTHGNRLFYIALPPGLYEPVAENIGQAGLSREHDTDNGWARLVVEKPFGTDLASAKQLNRNVREHFSENQIFRIDHYLAKETVQNILMFRFANAIFEPIWNRRYIDSIIIQSTETLGVEHRAGYYEQSGVIRDMFQNHMMQLLALTAMEPPARFEADPVRDEKIKVFRGLRPFPVESIEDYLTLGQYASGRIGGESVPAYRSESGVDPASLTPTFASMRLYLDNWRWQGVPFLITSGKRLAEKRTEIIVQFKRVPHAMFRRALEARISANRLVLGIYPEEKITLSFQTKNPGAVVCLRTVTMDFHYHQNYSGPVLDAYEKVLLDVMQGDQTLFWRQDGLEHSWAFLTPILSECENCVGRENRLHFYPAGSWGPEAAPAAKPKT
jgi:glucose-6-phosphate 1-dehydrogenase